MKEVIISRSFVEFGPFAIEEIHSFHQRGLLLDGDHLLIVGTEEWFGTHQLAGKIAGAKAAKAAQPAAKKAVKKTARKAAKKAAKTAPKPTPAPDSPTP